MREGEKKDWLLPLILSIVEDKVYLFSPPRKLKRERARETNATIA